MTLYCGIDLHANNCVVSVIDEQDKILFEQRLPNELEQIVAALARFQGALAGCVVESTYNWYWLVDGLMDAGFIVRLAHTGAIPQYAGLKYGNDHSDARHLAYLLRLGILPTGHILPKAQRMVRDLLRRRLLLVRQRTLHYLSLQSLLARYTGQRLCANEIKRMDVADVIQGLDPPIALGGELSWQTIQGLNQAIQRIEREIYARLTPRLEYRLLTSMPGVGQALGSTIVLETGGIDRFPGPGHYASYARCVKTERISNGKRKGRGNAKNGNRYLAWAFMEAAHYAAIWDPQIKRYYERRKASRHVLVAKKTVANKLARATYHMLKNEEPFDVKRAFG